MKQASKILSALIFGILLLPAVAKADYKSSYNYQKEFKKEIFNLLKSNNFTQLQEYLNNIPDCPAVTATETQSVCTLDRNDGKNFITHVLQRGFDSDYKDITLVNIDVGIYDALEDLYKHLYNKSPFKLDIANYKKFYKRFHKTWLADKVENILIKIWQRGSFLNKYDQHFEMMTGETVFTTLYLSKELRLNDRYKYVSDEISMIPFDSDPVFKNGINLYKLNAKRNRLHTILNQMKRGANKTASKELLSEVLSRWFTSIISYEGRDEAEQEYYNGSKQKQMYQFLNEEGWDMFGQNGLVPNEWQKHSVTLNVKSCRRVLKHYYENNYEEICSAFEKGAEKYGFYTSPETLAQQYEKQLNEALNKRSEQLDKGYFNPSF